MGGGGIIRQCRARENGDGGGGWEESERQRETRCVGSAARRCECVGGLRYSHGLLNVSGACKTGWHFHKWWIEINKEAKIHLYGRIRFGFFCLFFGSSVYLVFLRIYLFVRSLKRKTVNSSHGKILENIVFIYSCVH